MAQIDTLFLDIGGVLLTNGWDHTMRQEAANHFGFDYEEFEVHHNLVYPAHELGHISLEEYLDTTLFLEERPFSRQEFLAFMYSRSEPFPEMLHYLHQLKEEQKLRLVALSNEGRELIEHRITHCGLHDLLDFFIVSCFVHYRKADPNIYHMALDLVQRPGNQTVYLDDRKSLVEAARRFGIHAIHHHDFATTKAALDSLLSTRV